MKGISTDLLSVLISQVAVPELLHWLGNLHGSTVTDAEIIAKLGTDVDALKAKGAAALARWKAQP